MVKKRLISLCLIGVMLIGGIYGCGRESSSADIDSEKVDIATEEIDESYVTSVSNRSDSSVNKIGSSITWTNYSGESIQYTLNNIQTADNLKDLGIERKELTQKDTSSVSEDGALVDENYIFVAVDVTVKNINYPGLANAEGEAYRVYVENLLETESELQNVDGIRHNGEAAYFSEHGENEQQYYAFTLEPEQEKNAKLVWIVPKVDLEEPVYYIIGTATGRDTYQYFLLNEEN